MADAPAHAPGAAKSPAALRTISEVAHDLDLPQHILRFWETRFPELKPMKRGGNRRYYRPADIALCRALKRLLHEEGYTVKGVRRLIAEHGVRYLTEGPETAPTPLAVPPASPLISSRPSSISPSAAPSVAAIAARLRTALAQARA